MLPVWEPARTVRTVEDGWVVETIEEGRIVRPWEHMEAGEILALEDAWHWRESRRAAQLATVAQAISFWSVYGSRFVMASGKPTFPKYEDMLKAMPGFEE